MACYKRTSQRQPTDYYEFVKQFDSVIDGLKKKPEYAKIREYADSVIRQNRGIGLSAIHANQIMKRSISMGSEKLYKTLISEKIIEKSKTMGRQTSINFTKRGCNSTKAAKILKENREEYGKLLKKEIAKQKGKKSVTKAAKAASKKHHKMTWKQALKAASK